MSEIVPLAHAAATWYMVGVIWFVQIAHYPLFARVGVAGWEQYEQSHQARTSLVVVPAMLAELTTAVLLTLGIGVAPPPSSLRWIGAALLVVAWLSTFAVQVPLHARLAKRHSTDDLRRLVATNWIRTIAWSGRGAVALALL